MISEGYPLFLGPEHLTLKARENWSAQEAKENLEWLLGISDARVEGLLERLGESWSDDPSSHLGTVGKKAVALLKKEPFSRQDPIGRSLTDIGLALAADLGLLVAKYLLREHAAKLKWEVRRKGRREFTFNLPVLTGFANNHNDHLDPIGVSISKSWAVLRGERDFGAWERLYQDCLRNV